MLRFLFTIMKKAPLLCAIFLVWVILTILALTGRGRGYRKYNEDFGRHPLVSVVMRGIHDHVMPWSDSPPEEETSGTLLVDSGTQAQTPAASGQVNTDKNPETDTASQPAQADGKDADPAGQDINGNEASAQDEQNGAGDQDNGTAGNENKDNAGNQDNGTGGTENKDDAGNRDNGTAGTENKDSAGTENKESTGTEDKKSDGAGDKSKDESAGADGKDSGSQDPAAKDNTEDSTDQKDQKSSLQTEQVTGDMNKSMAVPETSCTRVVPAKDYGVAEERYLTPKGAEFNKDTEGLFAPNGVYYSLQKVDDKYFSDALFIGDSRTVGLFDYGGMESFTSFMARESTTVYDLFDDNEKMFYTPLGKKTTERTLKDLLSKAKFRKIYISVGVNELGIPDTMDYYQEFRKVVTRINKLQPDAIIYIQGIMHVSKDMSKKDHVFNNTAIVQRNQAISTLANGRNIFYIDMNEDLCDKDGNLKDDLTGDGIHLKASACALWYQFLKTHAIVIPD